MDGVSLPPGFRFSPTDEELVGYYLRRKIEGLDSGIEMIPVVDLYKFDPWELPDKSVLPKCGMEWFFFVPREHKYPNGKPNRPTTTGYWKATAVMDHQVVCKPSVVGYRKFLVFYDGKPPFGNKTNWVMHEYYLPYHVSQGSPTFKEWFALCRVINREEIESADDLSLFGCTSSYSGQGNDIGFYGSNVSGAEQNDVAITCLEEASETEYRTTEISISYEVLKQHFGTKLDDAAESLGVSRSTLKRICRNYGIKKWPNHKRSKVNSSPRNGKAVNKSVQGGNEQIPKSSRGCPSCSDQAKAAATTPNVIQLQDVVAIKVKYRDAIIKFQLSSSSGMAELVEKVTKRLPLKEQTFSIRYEDNDGDLVLITCDEDLQYCMDSSRSLPNKTTIRMFVDEPITNQAP